LATLGILISAFHQQTGIPSFHRKVFACLLMAVAMTVLFVLMRRKSALANIGSAILTGVLLIGFSAWITSWLDYGCGRKKLDIALSPGEVHGLGRLHDLARQNEPFATNKHAIDSIPINPWRSYGYGALSGRPVLLEGYLSRGENTTRGSTHCSVTTI
jgi:hypothetical protein